MIHGTCRDPASLVSHSLSIRNLGDLDVRSRLNRGVGQDPLVRGIVGPLRHLKIRHLEHVFPFFFGGRNRSYLLCDVESANLLSRKIQMLAVEVANSLYIFLHLLQVRSFSKQLKNQSPFKQKCERITGWPILLGILLVCQKDGLSKIVVYLLNPRAQGFIFPMNNGQKLKKIGHGNGSETISPPTKVGLSNIDIDQYCGSR